MSQLTDLHIHPVVASKKWEGLNHLERAHRWQVRKPSNECALMRMRAIQVDELERKVLTTTNNLVEIRANFILERNHYFLEQQAAPLLIHQVVVDGKCSCLGLDAFSCSSSWTFILFANTILMVNIKSGLVWPTHSGSEP